MPEMKIVFVICLAIMCWNRAFSEKVSKKASDTQYGPTIDELSPNDVSDNSPPAASTTGKDDRSVNDAQQLTKYPVSDKSSPMNPHAKDTNSLNSGNAPQLTKYPVSDVSTPMSSNAKDNSLNGGNAPQLTKYPVSDVSTPMSSNAKDNSLNGGNEPQFSKYPTRDTRKPDNLEGEWGKSEHTNDPNKEHTSDPNKEYTNDPNKEHTNDLNKDHTNDPNEDHTNDPNKAHTIGPNKDYTNDSNEDYTNSPSKKHTNDPNTEHTNDPNENTNDPDKEIINDPNKEHTNYPNKNLTNDPNSEITNDPNREHTNDPNREHNNDPNKITNDPNKEHTNDPNREHTNDPNKDHTNDPVNEHYDSKTDTKFGQKGESKMQGSPTHMLKEPEVMMHDPEHETILKENERLKNRGNSNEREQKPEKDEGWKEKQHLEHPEKEQHLVEQNVKDYPSTEEKRNGNEYKIEKEESEEEEPTNEILPQMSDGNVLWSRNEAEHNEEPWEEGGESSYFPESQPQEHISELISGKQGMPKDLKERWDNETKAKKETLERTRRQDELITRKEDRPKARVKREEKYGESRADYMGCYRDSNAARDFMGWHVFSWKTDNHPNKCIKTCFDKGFKYAAVQYGEDCHCGDIYGRYGPLSEGICNSSCFGHSAILCGGPLANAVYHTGYGMEGYFGCFGDNGNDRDLPTVLSTTWADNSPDKCTKECLKAGYKYAGMQNGTGCYCGNSYGKHGKEDEDECGHSCPGSQGLKCGGNGRNSIYRTSQRGQNYLGCYVDQSVDLDLPKFITKNWTSDNSPAKCTAACYKENFLYAGVQSVSRCWCGNSYGKHFSVQESDCDELCPGHKKTKCGGALTNSVYITGYGDFDGPDGSTPVDMQIGTHDVGYNKDVYNSVTPETAMRFPPDAGICLNQANIKAKVYWVAMDLLANFNVSSFVVSFNSTENNFYSVVSSKAEKGIFPPPKEVTCRFQKAKITKSGVHNLVCDRPDMAGRYASLIKYSSDGFQLCKLQINGQSYYALEHKARCGGDRSKVAYCHGEGAVCSNNKCKVGLNCRCSDTADCASGSVCQSLLCKLGPNGRCSDTADCASGSVCQSLLCKRRLNGLCSKTEDCTTGLVCDFLLRQCKQAYDDGCNSDSMCLSNSVCDDGKCKYGLMALCDGNPDSCATGLSCDLRDMPNMCKVELNSPCEPEECTSDAICDFHISQCRVAIKHGCNDKTRLCETATYCDQRNKCGNGVGDRCTHESKDDPCVAGALCTIMDECRCNAKVAKKKGKICEPNPGKYRGSCNETQACDKNMACMDKVCNCSQGYISTQQFDCKEEMSASTAGGGGQGILVTVLGAVFGVALVAVLAGVGYMQRKRSQEAKRNPMSPGPANSALPGPANSALPGPANPMSPGPANPTLPGPSTG